MGALDKLPSHAIEEVAKFFSHGELIGDMPHSDLKTFLESKYHRATLSDAVRKLTLDGKINQATANQIALNPSEKCGQEVATGIADEWGGQTVEGCDYPKGHEGPCHAPGKILPEKQSIQRRLEKLQSKEAQEKKDNEPEHEGNEKIQEMFDDSEEIPKSGTAIVQVQGKVFEDLIRRIAREEDQKVIEEVSLAFVDVRKDIANVNARVNEGDFSKVTLQPPAPSRIVLPELPGTTIETTKRRHSAFLKGLCLLRGGLNLYMYGPAGTGKTTLFFDWMEALGLPSDMISLSAGVNESAMTVRLLPLGQNGTFVPVMSPFMCRFGGFRHERNEDGSPRIVQDDNEAGGFLIDEVDGGDANMLLVTHSATANNQITIEQLATVGLKPKVVRAKRSVLVCAANTTGTGMDLLYAGRSPLDAAFLDRWYPIAINYDPAIEAEMMGMPTPVTPQWTPALPPTDAEIRELGKWCLHVRKIVERQGFRRVVGTRMLQKAIQARRAGIASNEIKNDLLAGWKADERSAVMGKLDE